MKSAIWIREQLNETLADLRPLSEKKRPVRGWLRSIREALGMSGRQLAERLGVKPPRISEMEKAEITGSISLKTLQKAAEALDCTLVYGLVPKTDLDSSLRSQALKAAYRHMASVSQSMQLEDQGLTPKEEARLLEAKAEEWIKDPPRWLWDLK